MEYKIGEIVYLKIQVDQDQTKLKPRFRREPQQHWVQAYYPDTKLYCVTDKTMFSPSLLVKAEDLTRSK